MTNPSRLDSVRRLARSRWPVRPASGSPVSPSRSPRLLLGRSFVVLMVVGVGQGEPEAVAQAADDGFHTIEPCRLVDTRQTAGPLGGPALAAGAVRVFNAVGNCQIPDSALAISANATVVSPTAAGNIRLFAGGTAIPATSTINYAAGQTRANNAVVALAVGGAFSAFVHQPSGTAHLVVDVTGYFATTGCAPAQRPPAPQVGVNTGTRVLFWAGVPGATSYDVYIRAEPGDCGVLPASFVTRGDQKLAGVTSPLDISAFDRCNTCYFVDAVSVKGECESPLQSDLGFPAPLSFSLLPCVP